MTALYNRINYGIHSIVPFSITDGKPFGVFKVIGGGTMTLTSEFEELFGGSNKFAFAVEAKTISTEWTATVKSFPDFMFELFLGATVVTTAASSSGTVSDFANILNTTVLDATTGIATVTAKSGSTVDLKDGIYIVEAVSATTVDIFALTDIEFNKLGAVNTLEYLNEDLRINASPLAIVQAAATEIVGLGVEMTGGSGVIALVTGDTARFSVRSAHNGVSEITIGASGTTFPEHKQLALGAKRANGDTFEMELFKVIGSGLPIPFEEQTFGIPELAMKLIYDENEDKVAVIRAKRA